MSITGDEGLGKGAAALVVGLAVFEIWKAYTSRAPTFVELSHAEQGGTEHQQLQDADLATGSLAVVAACAMFVLTRDGKLFALMLMSFAVISLWHHAILNRVPQSLLP